jgi:Flp pilus assembly protein TadD
MSLFEVRIGKAEPPDAPTHDALRTLARAARNEPGDPDYDYIMGDALLRAGRLQEALERCRDAVRLDGQNPDYRIMLGRVLWQSGRFEDAEPAFREAARLRPDAAAKNALGATLLRLGRFAEAERVLREALRADPARVEAYGNLAAVLWELGRRRDAIGVLRLGTRKAPHDGGAHRNLGRALLHAGQADEAAIAFRRAIACGDADAGAQLDLAEALAASGRGEEAAIAFAEAARLDPSAIADRPTALLTRDALRHHELRESAPSSPARGPSLRGALARALVLVSQAAAGMGGERRRLATLFVTCPLAALLWAGGRVAPHWFRHFLLHDDVVAVARAAVDSEAMVRDRLAHAVTARGLDTVLDPERCAIHTQGGWRRISCAYTVAVEVLPGYTRALAFRIDTEQPFVAASSP